MDGRMGNEMIGTTIITDYPYEKESLNHLRTYKGLEYIKIVRNGKTEYMSFYKSTPKGCIQWHSKLAFMRSYILE